MSETITSGNTIGQDGCNHGPFVDASGNLYVVLNGNAFTSIEVWKRIWSTGLWERQDTVGNEPSGADTYVSAWMKGTDIHMVSNSSADTGFRYHRFSTSTDTWSETDTIIVSLTDAPNAGVRPLGIVVRASSNDRVVLYRSSEKIHGTTYDRAAAIEYVTSWGSEIQLGTWGGTTDWRPMAIALGEADKVHFHIFDQANSDCMHTSLADGSSTPSTAEDTDATSLWLPLSQRSLGVYNDESGVESIKFVSMRASGATAVENEIRDDATPEGPVAIVTSDVGDAGGILVNAPDHPSGAYIYFVYEDSATDDIYFREDTGSGWGSATEFLGSVTMQSNTNIDGIAWEQPTGDYVLGLVWYDGTNTVYDEYVLVSGGTTLTISDWSVGVTLDAPTLTQVHNLLVNDWSIASTLDTFAITQAHNLTVQDWSVTVTLDNIASIPISYNLTVQDLSVGVTLDTFALTQVHVLTVNDWAVSTTLDTFALTQLHNLTVADWSVGVTLDNIILGVEATLTVQDWSVGVTLDNVVLTQAHNIIVQDLAVSVTLDNVVLSVAGTLVIQDWAVGVTLDTFALTQVHNISVADLAVSTTLDTFALTQVHNISVADLSVSSVLDTFALVQQHNIVVADWEVATTLDALVIQLGSYNLVVQDWSVGVTLDDVGITVTYNLAVQDWAVGVTLDGSVFSTVYGIVMMRDSIREKAVLHDTVVVHEVKLRDGYARIYATLNPFSDGFDDGFEGR